MAGVWAYATRRLGHSLRLRQVPLLALGAAFSFVIMMFNVPIPGGTTGHAVGAVLIAILLGPWAAVIAVSLALIMQALLHGDGGITTIGANCFNLALVMPFTGWWAYRLVAGRAPVGSPRHLLAGTIGGYVGLNAAALSTAVMLGIQPLISHGFCPFGLHITVPVMVGEHVLFFGFVEAAVTGMVLAFLARTEPGLFPTSVSTTMPRLMRLAIALLVLALLTPLGLLLPTALRAGGAWGEWGPDEIAAKIHNETGQPGFVPTQMERLSRLWQAPLPDYAISGAERAPLWVVCLLYVGCALVGIGLLVLLALALKKLCARKEPDDHAAGVDVPSTPV